MGRSIKPLIHRKIVVLHENDTSIQAAKAMKSNNIGCVVVFDKDGQMTGIVTDRDIACRVVGGMLPIRTRLREVMTSQVSSILESASIEDAIVAMEKLGVRRIPVMKDDGSSPQKCVGLVSLDDLIAADEISPQRLRQIVKSQILRRHRQGPLRQAGPASSKFIRELARVTGVTESQAEEFARFVFASIVRRLTYSASVQFILQLPESFQPKLFDISSGPDRTVKVSHVLEGAGQRLKQSQQASRKAIQALWQLLSGVAEPGQLAHTFNQLPVDFQRLLSTPQLVVSHDFDQWAEA